MHFCFVKAEHTSMYLRKNKAEKEDIVHAANPETEIRWYLSKFGTQRENVLQPASERKL